MASGVKIDEECKKKFTDLKNKHLYQFVIYKISDCLTKVEVETTAPHIDAKELDEQTAQVKDVYMGAFTDALKAAEDNKQCRYALFDLCYKHKSVKKEKVLLIKWSPENATVKQKMIYASSVDALKASFSEGGIINMQATDDAELEWDQALAKCQEFARD